MTAAGFPASCKLMISSSTAFGSVSLYSGKESVYGFDEPLVPVPLECMRAITQSTSQRPGDLLTLFNRCDGD